MKLFTLEDANAALPRVRETVLEARHELTGLFQEVQAANDALLRREWTLREARIEGHGEAKINECKLDWDDAAADLEAFKRHYAERQRDWTRRFTTMGVIVRDLEDGLVDFPAEQDGLEFYYCWQLGEDRVGHWHLRDAGFAGRQPVEDLTVRLSSDRRQG